MVNYIIRKLIIFQLSSPARRRRRNVYRSFDPNAFAIKKCTSNDQLLYRHTLYSNSQETRVQIKLKSETSQSGVENNDL